MDGDGCGCTPQKTVEKLTVGDREMEEICFSVGVIIYAGVVIVHMRKEAILETTLHILSLF